MRLSQILILKLIRARFWLISRMSKRKAAEKAFQLFCTPQTRLKKSLPPLFERAEQMKFTLENYTINGFRWNHPSPERVLIMHGFESGVLNFENYIEPLIKKGFEVLAFDAPAHGRSSGNTINVITYKNFVHEINRRFGPVKSFITHSFGGLALSLAVEEMDHNEEFRIVFIAPAAETQTAIDNFFRLLKLDDGVRNEFEKLIISMGGKDPSWYSLTRASANIRARVLYLQDKDDIQTPLSDVKPLIERNYPNFHFIISTGLGHRKIYREPKSVKAVMEFLSEGSLNS